METKVIYARLLIGIIVSSFLFTTAQASSGKNSGGLASSSKQQLSRGKNNDIRDVSGSSAEKAAVMLFDKFSQEK